MSRKRKVKQQAVAIQPPKTETVRMKRIGFSTQPKTTTILTPTYDTVETR